MNNVLKEKDLYEPMRLWLHQFLSDRYKNKEIITIDCHTEKLYKVLHQYDVSIEQAIGLYIEIDVLGIVKTGKENLLFFIEAKKTDLTIRDLGQLWAYCKLVNPEMAFLFSSKGIGCFDKILNVYHRQDMLEYFRDKRLTKAMHIAKWDISSNMPDLLGMIPTL